MQPVEHPGEAAQPTAAEAEIEILYDHYKEGLSELAAQVRARLRLLAFLLTVLGAMVVETMSSPDRSLIGPLLSYLGDLKVGELDIPQHLWISLLWFLLGSLVLLMNQKSLLIEEQNAYVRQVESRLDGLLGGGWIFKKRIPQRPTYLKVANFFYFVSYVLVLAGGCGLVLYKVWTVEWPEADEAARPYFVAFDTAIFLLFIVGSTVQFMRDFQRSEHRNST